MLLSAVCVYNFRKANIRNDENRAVSGVFDYDPLTVVNPKLKHKDFAFGNTVDKGSIELLRLLKPAGILPGGLEADCID